MEYKATLDLKSKIITGSTAVLFLVIITYNARMIDIASMDLLRSMMTIATTLLIIVVFIFCYLYRPLKYIVDNHQVVVKRPLKDFIIDFGNIKEVFLPSKDAMDATIRTFGNGGIFGYFGRFRNSTYGGMKWFATRTENYVMIVTKDNTRIVLTPDNTDMIKEIKVAKGTLD